MAQGLSRSAICVTLGLSSPACDVAEKTINQKATITPRHDGRGSSLRVRSAGPLCKVIGGPQLTDTVTLIRTRSQSGFVERADPDFKAHPKMQGRIRRRISPVREPDNAVATHYSDSRSSRHFRNSAPHR